MAFFIDFVRTGVAFFFRAVLVGVLVVFLCFFALFADFVWIVIGIRLHNLDFVCKLCAILFDDCFVGLSRREVFKFGRLVFAELKENVENVAVAVFRRRMINGVCWGRRDCRLVIRFRFDAEFFLVERNVSVVFSLNCGVVGVEILDEFSLILRDKLGFVRAVKVIVIGLVVVCKLFFEFVQRLIDVIDLTFDLVEFFPFFCGEQIFFRLFKEFDFGVFGL